MPSNGGKASREVVAALISDLREFDAFVLSEADAMKQETDRLGSSWRDPQYDQFAACIADLTNALCADLVVFREAADALQRKLDMYDD
jgi:hypothetical protein